MGYPHEHRMQAKITMRYRSKRPCEVFEGIVVRRMCLLKLLFASLRDHAFKEALG